jgi:hypothetical protein
MDRKELKELFKKFCEKELQKLSASCLITKDARQTSLI